MKIFKSQIYSEWSAYTVVQLNNLKLLFKDLKKTKTSRRMNYLNIAIIDMQQRFLRVKILHTDSVELGMTAVGEEAADVCTWQIIMKTSLKCVVSGMWRN